MVKHLKINYCNILIKVKVHIYDHPKAEKTHDKIQYPSVIKLGIRRNFFNLTKDSYKKPTAQIILDAERLKTPPLRRNKARMLTLTTFIQHLTGHALRVHSDKKNNRHLDWKEVKLSFFFKK